MVEFRSADIVQVPEQRKDAPALLVVPDFDLEVVASGNEQWLLAVEGDATYRAIVFIELLQQRVHTIVPQLDDTIV